MVFDIETVPDVELGRNLLGLDGVNDEDTAKAMVFNNLQSSGSDFLPLYQHRIVAISVVVRKPDSVQVLSFGDEDSSEADLIRLFYGSIEKHTPELVSWNGGGFDLPVLHYRALRHKVQAHTYWDVGGENPQFKWNNYLSRFHWRHIDVMDVLSGYQPRARAGLDDSHPFSNAQSSGAGRRACRVQFEHRTRRYQRALVRRTKNGKDARGRAHG